MDSNKKLCTSSFGVQLHRYDWFAFQFRVFNFADLGKMTHVIALANPAPNNDEAIRVSTVDTTRALINLYAGDMARMCNFAA